MLFPNNLRTRRNDWLKLLLTPIPAAAAYYGFEVLIECVWLGHGLPYGRMWVNLALVALVTTVVVVLAADTFLALCRVTGGCVLAPAYALTLIITAPTIGWPILDALYTNPAINWQSPQRLAYTMGICLVASCCIGWYLGGLTATTEDPPKKS